MKCICCKVDEAKNGSQFCDAKCEKEFNQLLKDGYL